MADFLWISDISPGIWQSHQDIALERREAMASLIASTSRPRSEDDAHRSEDLALHGLASKKNLCRGVLYRRVFTADRRMDSSRRRERVLREDVHIKGLRLDVVVSVK